MDKKREVDFSLADFFLFRLLFRLKKGEKEWIRKGLRKKIVFFLSRLPLFEVDLQTEQRRKGNGNGGSGRK